LVDHIRATTEFDPKKVMKARLTRTRRSEERLWVDAFWPYRDRPRTIDHLARQGALA
jgi:hypothetical protein